MGKPIAKTVEMRAALPTDCDLVYGWQSEPLARRYFHNPAIPEYDDHKEWFAERLAREDPDFWIIEVGENSVGFLRLDCSDQTGSACSISVLIASQFQGRGYGSRALNILRDMMPDVRLVAEIHPDNKASLRMFEKSGYLRQSETVMISDPDQSNAG